MPVLWLGDGKTNVSLLLLLQPPQGKHRQKTKREEADEGEKLRIGSWGVYIYGPFYRIGGKLVENFSSDKSQN